jgi:RNA polymerase sigma-70 factor, ECF subfamily
MDPGLRRSTDVSSVATATAPAARLDSSRLAFEELYRESRDDVYGYVSGLIRDRSAAEEVTATAFERAWRRRRQLDPKRGSARAWLFGIARHAALDELRRLKRRASLETEPDDRSATAPEEHAEGVVRRATVRAALATLDPRERDLVALKFQAGLSNAEIARVLGTTESNVGTRLHRAMEKLRRECDDRA